MNATFFRGDYHITFGTGQAPHLGRLPPKVHVGDSGLACHLCGADAQRLADDFILAGRLLESFVAGELLKQSSWTEHPVPLYHYRSQSGEEVDVARYRL